ncbi:hypothetical protein M752DRAFT_294572 [Aspergillus phoenicis ATCC 13157]|uniref:Ig-like domain-containing protein n=1 Tax=Aspergillus phoenicis ATCC 13157 TaxID=1353007 RepID=A0A370PHT1_ASPPH|nr:hypothetical protein M752DRAFT_294572 [Aspergillus phoenicis ATCC 13157]
MKLGLMIIYILSAAVGSMGAVENASFVYDANIDKLVLKTTSFPAPQNRYDRSLPRRASDAAPTCSIEYGAAPLNETVANIAHLFDIADSTCSVGAATCARVSHEGSSSIFWCNFEGEVIYMRCGDLVGSTEQVSDACRVGDRYTYGYVSRSMVDGSQSYPYLVVIGGDYVFEV